MNKTSMKTLSIVIPFYNEGERIDKTLKIMKKGFSCCGVKLEKVIFVNDGSEDRTLKLVSCNKKQLEKTLRAKVKIISYFPNKGRGYAIRASTLITNTDYVLYTDSDFSIPLENLNNFIPYLMKNYDLCFGSKKIPGAIALIPRGKLRTIVGYGHSLVASIVFGIFAWDYQGGFKIFSKKFIREVFPKLTIDRWGFDMEVIYLAKKLGYSTAELPVVWGHVENSSKVKLLRDIFRSLKDMIMIRLIWMNRKLRLSFATFIYQVLGNDHDSTFLL